jgi:hypothetical protein
VWVVPCLLASTAEIELARTDITRMKLRRSGQGEDIAASRVKQGIVTSVCGYVCGA